MALRDALSAPVLTAGRRAPLGTSVGTAFGILRTSGVETARLCAGRAFRPRIAATALTLLIVAAALAFNTRLGLMLTHGRMRRLDVTVFNLFFGELVA